MRLDSVANQQGVNRGVESKPVQQMSALSFSQPSLPRICPLQGLDVSLGDGGATGTLTQLPHLITMCAASLTAVGASRASPLLQEFDVSSGEGEGTEHPHTTSDPLGGVIQVGPHMGDAELGEALELLTTLEVGQCPDLRLAAF